MNMGYLSTGIDLLGLDGLIVRESDIITNAKDGETIYIAACIRSYSQKTEPISKSRNPHAKGFISESVVRMKPLAYLCEMVCTHWENYNEDLKHSSENPSRV